MARFSHDDHLDAGPISHQVASLPLNISSSAVFAVGYDLRCPAVVDGRSLEFCDEMAAYKDGRVLND
jgi:hypothetical protein